MLISGKQEFSPKSMLMDGNIEYNINKLEENQDPRILSSHLPYRLLPLAHRQNNYKIILIVRNPKDRTVSSFNFLKNKYDSFDSSYKWMDFLTMSSWVKVSHKSKK